MRLVGRLAADRPRREQAGGLQLGGGEELIDGGLDRPRRIDDDAASRFVAAQAIHAKDDLLQRARRHRADEHGVELGQVAAAA